MKSDSYWRIARLKFFSLTVLWGIFIVLDISLASARTDQEGAQKLSPLEIEARNFLQEHQYAQAEQSFKKALANTPANDTKTVIDLLNYIGTTLHAQKKEKEACEYFTKGLSALTGKMPGSDLLKAKILSNLSLVYSAQGNFIKAKECCEEALSLFRKEEAAPLDLAVLLNTYGRLAMDARELEKAEALFAESIAVREKIRGKNSIELVYPLVNLSGALLEQKKMAQAEEACRRAIVICQQQDGDDSQKVFPLLLNLAALQVEQYQYKEAISTFNRAREIAEKYFGRSSKETLTTYFALAEFYEKDGQATLSEQSLTRAVEICRLLYGQQDRKTLEATLSLAHLFQLHGNSTEAERLRLLCRLTQDD